MSDRSPCPAAQVDAGETRHEGDLHSDHNMTVAIFYNGYTDGCGAAPCRDLRMHAHTPRTRDLGMLCVQPPVISGALRVERPDARPWQLPRGAWPGHVARPPSAGGGLARVQCGGRSVCLRLRPRACSRACSWVCRGGGCSCRRRCCGDTLYPIPTLGACAGPRWRGRQHGAGG